MSDPPSVPLGLAKALVAQAWYAGYLMGFRRGLVLGVLCGAFLAIIGFELYQLLPR